MSALSSGTPDRLRLPLAFAAGLWFVALAPVLASVKISEFSLTGLLTPLVALLGVLELLLGERARHLPRFGVSTLLFLTVVWFSWISLFRGVPIDHFTVQQTLSYLLFVVFLLVGTRLTRFQPSLVSREILRAASAFTVVNSLTYFVSELSGRWYPFSPVLPAVIAVSVLPWLKSRPNLVLFVAVTNFVVILGSGNRTMPAIIFAATVAGLFGLRREAPLRNWLSGVGVAALPVAVAFANPELIPYGQGRWHGGDQSVSLAGVSLNTNGRAEIWGFLWSVGEGFQPWGAGVGSASRKVEELVPGIEHPHNDYLRVWFDFGLLGMALFLATAVVLIASVGYSSARTSSTGRELRQSATLSMVSVGIAMVTLNPLVIAGLMFWIAILLGIVLTPKPDISHHRREDRGINWRTDVRCG